MKKLVASAKLILDEKDIDDDCLKGIKLYHTNTDANDDSFDEQYHDDELAIRDILKNTREIDLKMFTARWEISGFCLLSFCQNERI